MIKHRVAVLLASYNGEKYIREQIMSILNQEDVYLHIFVRDDGSSDRTRAIILEIIKKSHLITLLPKGESTGSAAGNFLYMLSHLDLAGFTHVSLADQDDIWAARKLVRAVEQMAIEDADGYSSDLICYAVDKQRVQYLKKSSLLKSHDYLFQGASAGCTYVLSIKLTETIRHKVMHVPSLDFKTRSHDWLIYAIARSAGYKWICDIEAHIFYRQHATNVYGARSSFGGLIAKLNHIRSGWYRQNVIWLQQFISNNEYESKIFQRMERWSLADRLYVVTHAYLFRRRQRDVWVLAVFALLGLM
jgi:rhamnosyltransferase